MKNRKPKTKRKAKRNSEQQPPPAVEQLEVPTPVTNQEPVNPVETLGETGNPASIVEIRPEIEACAAAAELRDENTDSTSLVELPSETEDPAEANESQAEIESSAAPAEHRGINEDTASTVELRHQSEQSEDLERILEIHVEVENFATPVEIQDVIGDATGNPTAPPEIYSASEIPVIPVATPPVAGKPDPRTAADRRAHPRYAFTAAIEVVATELGARIATQVRDLSQQGCFVDTDRPLGLGTATHVRITKGTTLFEASARVVYNQTGKGMGLMFTTVELEHLRILDTWIAESRESSWRAANRRRSQRVLMRVPVRVSGQAADGASFEEETHTLSISPHGALLVLTPAVQRGQRFILANLQTKAALECVVAHLERLPGEPIQVGVEFSLPNPAFWRVAFPPKDWTPRHPDAKSR
jgi:hypothetical protein